MSEIPRNEWEWFGNHGHFIAGRDCRFHLATLVGPWWVSTVGEYLPDSRVRDVIGGNVWERIGSNRTYETMVFRAGEKRCASDDCSCGMPVPDDWSELDADGYNDAGSATRGHYALCEKWAAIPVDAEVPA